MEKDPSKNALYLETIFWEKKEWSKLPKKYPRIGGGESKKKKNLDFEILHQKCVENPGGHHGTLRIFIRTVFEELEQFL